VLLFLHVGRDFLLTLDGEHEVLDVDVDVFARHVGQLDLQHELVIAGLKDVDRRHPGTWRGKPEVAKRIPTNDGHMSSYDQLASAYSPSTTSASLTFEPDEPCDGCAPCAALAPLYICSAIACDARCSSSIAFFIASTSLRSVA